MADMNDDLSPHIAALRRMRSLSALLTTLCEISGMGVAAVVRERAGVELVCAVHDGIGLGLEVGDALPFDARRDEQADSSTYASAVAAARIKSVRSGLSARIALAEGQIFGHLRVFDSRPPDPDTPIDPRVLAMLARFAGIVAEHLDDDRAAQSARVALADERAAAALREEFAAILGHDLRNPLSAILAWARVLQMSGADCARVAKAGARIEASANRMILLIENTLDHARARFGDGLSARIEPQDGLATALEDIVEELRRASPQKEARTAIDIPCPVFCDKGRIQQLASNLLGNAIAHGDPAGPVELRARARDGFLSIEVWNSGDPISPSDMVMVFKPFWRASSGGSRRGLGLGLHICDLIVKAHGGTLSVESTRESGTTFTARVPLSA